MSPFNALFTACTRPFRARSAAGSSSRRVSSRRLRQRAAAARLGGCEQLESKQLLAVDLVQPITAPDFSQQSVVEIALANHFDQTDVSGTVVRFDTNRLLGTADFYVELFDSQRSDGIVATPQSAAAFLQQVGHQASGSAEALFDNSIIHNNGGGFIQGGALKQPSLPSNEPLSDPAAIPDLGLSVPYEAGNSNTRGAIAMVSSVASGGAVSGASSGEWFINTRNNSGYDGSYTAFGRVLGTGMEVVDAIAGAPASSLSTIYGSNSSLAGFSTPLWRQPTNGVVMPEDFVAIRSARVVPELSFVAESSNPSVIRAQIDGGTLVLSQLADSADPVTVTVTASSVFQSADPQAVNSRTYSFLVNAPTNLQNIEAAGNTRLQRDAGGNLYANGQPVTMNGTAVKVSTFAALGQPKAAEDFGAAGGKQLAWATSTGGVIRWQMRSDWSYDVQNGLPAILSADSAGIANAERQFGVDFNGDNIVAPPTIAVTPIGEQTITSGSLTIDLADYFDETTVTGSLVRFDTNAPLTNDTFFVELFDKPGVTNLAGGAAVVTPTTATNFLSYVNDNSYDNTFIHRAVDSFVVQGGGYKTPTLSADQPGSDPVAVTARAAITNEAGNANQRGTIAMAKLAGQTNSATNQFYFNLGNNTNLNTDNGGYAVFGKVLGSGMTVIDTMANALTYDATTYYGNGALSDLPLWNINADNIIDPQDFVTLEDVSVVPETALMSFTVTSSNTSKLTASVVNGQLRLTPVAGQTGTVNVTVSGTSSLGGAAVSDTFVVNLGVSRTAVSTDTTGVVLEKDNGTRALFVGSSAVTDTRGASVRDNSYAGYTPLLAETIGGVNYVLWQRASDKALYRWTLDSTWKQTGLTAYLNGTAGYFGFETAFGIDANGDGTIGQSRSQLSTDSGSVLIEVDASTSVMYVGSSVIKNSAGTTIRTNSFTGWTPLAAETIDSVNYLIWRNDATKLVHRWVMDSGWRQTSFESVSSGSATYVEIEDLFDIDANEDSFVGAAPAPVVTDVSGVRLLEVTTTRVLYVGTMQVRNSAGSVVKFDSFSGWSPLAAETIEGTNYVVWVNASTKLVHRWEMDANWRQTSFASIATTDSSYVSMEEAFGVDANGDGTVGPARSGFSTDTSGVVLEKDNGTRALFVGASAVTDTRGASVRDNSYAGFSPLLAETIGGVNYVLWQRASDKALYRWTLDSTWKQTGLTAYPNGTAGYFGFETAFGIDANGDGTIGQSRSQLSTDSGSVLIEVDASTSVMYVGSSEIKNSAGTTIRTNSFTGWTPLAAETINSVNYLIWRNDATKLVHRWVMDSGWRQTSFESVSAGSTTYVEIEDLFDIDANDDSFVGEAPAPVGTDTTGVRLLEVTTTRVLYVGTMQVRNSAGSVVKFDSFSGWSPLAAETIEGTNYVVWVNASTKLVHRCVMDANWRQTSFASIASTDSAYTSMEEAFAVDANGDGAIGVARSGFSTDTTGVILEKDNGTRALFVGSSAVTDTRGASVRDNSYAGYTPLLAETIGGVNYVLWQRASDKALYRWTLDSTWKQTGLTAYLNGTAGYFGFETTFGIDANGTGGIGA